MASWPWFSGILEELVADQFFLVDHDLFGAVADDHVVDPLVGRASDLRLALDDVEILAERAGPVFFLVVVKVLTTGDQRDQSRSGGHENFPSSKRLLQNLPRKGHWGLTGGPASSARASLARAPPRARSRRPQASCVRLRPNCQRATSKMRDAGTSQRPAGLSQIKKSGGADDVVSTPARPHEREVASDRTPSPPRSLQPRIRLRVKRSSPPSPSANHRHLVLERFATY